MTRFKLLAVDIDGTLVGPGEPLRAGHAEALAAAKRAGMTVCLCTGRSVAEARPVWLQCALPGRADPIIAVGGAVVFESDTARTLHIEPLAPAPAIAASEVLRGRGLSTVALVDSWREGFDYYLVAGDDARAARAAWLDRHECTVREVRSLTDVPALPALLRLTALPDGVGEDVEELLRRCGDGHLAVGRIRALNYGIDLLECLSPRANKWTGVRYVSQGLRIARRDIVAIGDDINDLPMIERAGLGVAMGNAPDPVQAAADHVAGLQADDGLAEFIEQLLAGQFDGLERPTPGAKCGAQRQ